VFAVRAAFAFDGDRSWPGGAWVLIDGTRVKAVESATQPVPSGVSLIDFPRGSLLPGLVNTHVHLCGDSGRDALERLPAFSTEEVEGTIDVALGRQLASGVTTVRDLGDRHWAVLERRDRTPPDSPAPRIVASGPPITSPGGHCWHMGGEAAGEEALRRAVRERVARRVDVIKVMASGGFMTPDTDITACQFSVEELRWVVDEAHHHGLGVTAHAHPLAAVERAINAGVDGIEHCSCVTAKGSEMSDALIGQLRDRRIAVCPTFGMAPGVALSASSEEFVTRHGMTLEQSGPRIARAHNAGVTVVSGDDGGISPAKRHGNFAEAIIDLHNGGVSVSDALRSATAAAAQVCDIGDRTGRLQTGHDADVLVVDGDATTDPTCLRSVAMIIANGQIAIDSTKTPTGQ
jgi:imidazolonepropionase-like amidohydrolase